MKEEEKNYIEFFVRDSGKKPQVTMTEIADVKGRFWRVKIEVNKNPTFWIDEIG